MLFLPLGSSPPSPHSDFVEEISSTSIMSQDSEGSFSFPLLPPYCEDTEEGPIYVKKSQDEVLGIALSALHDELGNSSKINVTVDDWKRKRSRHIETKEVEHEHEKEKRSREQ